MPLTALGVKSAKPQDKPYKLSDEKGLYLLVTPSGSKLWRFDYRFADKRKTLAFGKWDDVELAGARERRDAARKSLWALRVPAIRVARGELGAFAIKDGNGRSLRLPWVVARSRSLAVLVCPKRTRACDQPHRARVGRREARRVGADLTLSMFEGSRMVASVNLSRFR
jgi:hypothetical protein